MIPIEPPKRDASLEELAAWARRLAEILNINFEECKKNEKEEKANVK